MAGKKPKLKDALKRHLSEERAKAYAKKKEEGARLKREKERLDRNAKLRSVHVWGDGMRTGVPFRPEAKVLVVGDGDFTYSLALATLLGNTSAIVPSVLESREGLLEKHPGALNTVQELEKLPNVDAVMFGVEASALAEAIRRRPGFSPDAVVFNFPHTGSGIKDRARNIVSNQQLLHKFFRSSSEALGAGGAAEKASFTSTRAAYRPTAGHASVDGCAGSEDEDDGAKGPAVVASVVPYVLVTMWQGDPYDSWDLKAIARTYSFRCSHAFEFDFMSYPGYAHCRTDGVKDIGVGKKQRAVTYVFVKATAIVDG